MKKTIIIISILVALFIATLLAIPLIFKQTLIEKAKSAINSHIHADVEFSGLKLSLFRSFPKVSLALTDVFVTGRDEFQHDTLFSVPALKTKTSIRQLFSEEGIGIDEIVLEHPRLKLVVGTSGLVNWDLTAGEAGAPATSPASAEETDDGLVLQLEKVAIQDGRFIYEDRETNMILRFDGIDINISGKMYGTEALLEAEGKSQEVSFDYLDVNYLSNTAVETRTLLEVDYDKMDILIRENELFVNRLPLEVLGMISIPNDSMFFDLNLKTKESGFDNFLALVPPEYEEYLKDIQTSGTAVISGTVNGYYIGEEYPAFDIKLDVSGGNLHYAELPEEIRDISADVSIRKPQGVIDLTRIDIHQAHAKVKNSPIDLVLTLQHMVTDPWFDGTFIGNINFLEWKDALPLDSMNLSGIIEANLKVKGNYSAIEKEQYEKIQSDGIIRLTNFEYESTDLTQPVIIPDGKLTFTPQTVTLSGMNLLIGQSDFRLSGKVSNYLNYLLKDGILAGNLQLNSSRINLNELLRLQVKPSPAYEQDSGQPSAPAADNQSAESETLVFDVPANIDFTFQSDINQVLFDQLPLTDVNGLITARNGKLALDDLNMGILDGKLKLSGSYQNTPENHPLFDFNFDLASIDIPKAYQALSAVRRMIPIARQSAGRFNTNIRLNGQLTPDFKLKAPSLDGNGIFSTENLRIIESPLFNQLKGLLKPEKLKNISIDDFKASVEVVDGAIQLKPFQTKIAGQETTISGNLNPGNLLTMRLDFNVQREAFGTDIQNILQVIPGQERILTIPASVILNGPVGKPDVKIDLDDARKQITEEIKRSTQENMQKNLNKLGEGLKNLLKKEE
ncbi:MAG: AsmA family protein [Mariniphaga sp.]